MMSMMRLFKITIKTGHHLISRNCQKNIYSARSMTLNLMFKNENRLDGPIRDERSEESQINICCHGNDSKLHDVVKTLAKHLNTTMETTK
jgi:hypothetical protein